LLQARAEIHARPYAKGAARTQAAKPPAKKAEPKEAIPPSAPNALFPAVVAKVNGKSILGRDLEQRVRAELAAIGNPAWKDLREDYRKELTGSALAQLVGDELLYQKATSVGVSVSQTDVQAEFEKIAKTYPDDAAMNTELANRGMDRAALMQALAKELVIDKYLRENVTGKIVITPEEVAKYHAEYPDQFKHPDLIRSSHILITVPPGANAEQEKQARQRAEDLLARLKKGEDFAALAKDNSMDPSASRGGDIGLTADGDLEAEYEQAAAKLKVGEISDVVRTVYGFHIIKLTDRKKAGIATLDEVREELSAYLKSQKEDDEIAKLVQTLQSQSKIEILITG